jgi:hypothetical protein
MNRKIQIVLMTLCVALLLAWGGLGTAQAADNYAQWDFNDNLYSTAPGGQAATVDATVEAFNYVDATIDGQAARVAEVTTGASNRYVRLPFNFDPNGGQTDKLGKFTVICDMKMPIGGVWCDALQPSISTLIMAWVWDDYIYDYGYMSGWVQGPEKFNAGDWNRVVMTVDKTQTTGGIKYFFNGGLAGTCDDTDEIYVSSLLAPTGAEIGASVYGDYVSNQQFNSIQIVPYTFTEAQVAALGGPKAAGIPAPALPPPAPPGIIIGPPSVFSTLTGPVDFPVTYVPGVPEAMTVNLTADKVSLLGSEGPVTGTVEITDGTTPNPTITVKDITGFGKLRVLILPGTASNATGPAGFAGPSRAVPVYPLLPDAPTAPATGGMKLWWDASNVNGANNTGIADGAKFATWKDRSGNGNDGLAHGGVGATLRKTVADLNNKAAVEFINDRAETYDFTTPILDIRSVFWVVKKVDPDQMHFLLGLNGGENVWCDTIGGYIWNSYWTSDLILDGVTRVQGEVVNGAMTNLIAYGNTIVSLDTTGNVGADYFSGDPRNNYLTNRQWEGTLSELIIYNRVLTDQERNQTGSYLAAKYGKNASYGYPDAPVVTLVYPGATVAAPLNTAVDLKATARPGAGARIAAMEFYVDWELAGTVTTPNAAGEFVFPWTTPGAVGSHDVFARALDNRTPAFAAMSAVGTIAVVNPLFVAPAELGTKDGSSWANAMTLDNALAAAGAASGEAALIYIKTGTYTRAASYKFLKGAALYGGFAGTETTPAQRTGTPGVDNVTTLDAGGTVEGIFDNGGKDVTLDRLKFTRSADSAVALWGGTNTVHDCAFADNAAVGPGGGILVEGGTTNVTRSVFKDNSAAGWGGGGIGHYNGNVTLDSCWFENNETTELGGAFCNYWGDLIVTNSVFVNNSSGGGGGAIETDGAPAWIFNNTFVGNQSTGTEFSGVWEGAGGGSVVYVVNNIFSGHAGQAVGTDTGGPAENIQVMNNLFYNSSVNPTLVTVSGSVSGNPLFVSATDLHLQAGSPAINQGLTGSFGGYGVPTADYAGLSRFDGQPDLGAYEIAVTGALAITPDPLNFGVVVKETTSTQTLTLANSGGNLPITISAITLTGDTEFSLVDPPTLPVTLLAGESLDIVVAFTAPLVTARVPHSGTVTVANTGAVTPATGSLNAIAAPSLFPGEPPTVVVERSAGTPATTKVFPIEFNITFSEGVTGFELGDIEWAGSVPVGNVTATLIPREATGAQYTVRITEITGMGAGTWTVNPVVPAGVCETIGKYANEASNTDAVVTYETSLFGVVITTTAAEITDAATVTCTVTFDTPVKAVDALALIESKLSVAGTSAGASIASVLEDNPSTAYTVEITTGGDGTLALALNDDDAIMDLTDAPLNGTGSSIIHGPVIEVDKTAPTVVSIRRAFGAARGTNETIVIFEVTFSDIVTGVDADDFAIACSDATADVASVATLGNTALVVCNVKAAVGPYALSVKTAATMTNRVGLDYETGTPDPNEDYFILTQAPQTSVETWSWTLY